MKKILLLVVCFMLLSCVPSNAAYLVTGYLANDQVMSEPLKSAELSLAANIEYFSAREAQINVPGSDDYPEWGSISDAKIDSFSMIVVPMKLAYGITDSCTFRITFPYVSVNEERIGKDAAAAAGFGDIRIETLFQFLKETDFDPAVSGNIAVKFPFGSRHLSSDDKLDIGTGTTDLYIYAVIQKRIWRVDHKFLLGYGMIGPTTDKLNEKIDLSNPMMYSWLFSFPVNEQFKFGGELWGSVAGEDKIDGDGLTDSNTNPIYFSPFMTFKQSEDLSCRMCLDLPLSQSPTYSMANVGLNSFRGLNVSLGMTWTTR